MKYSEIYKRHKGKVSDKWSSYLHFYDELTESVQLSSILEIGVQNGGSLEIWATKFPEARLIAGVDVDERCRDLEFQDDRIRVLVGDASDPATQRELKRVSETFQLIVDDGSHRSSDIIKALVQYLPMLEPGGIYVIEDLHASYWQSWQGGLVEPRSAMSFLKKLADVVNFEHWDQRVGIAHYLAGYEELSEAFLTSIGQLRRVVFENSMCTLYVSGVDRENSLGMRVTAGTSTLVNADVVNASGQLSTPEVWKYEPTPLDSFKPGFSEQQSLQINALTNELSETILKFETVLQERLKLETQLSEIFDSRLWRMSGFLRKRKRLDR